MRTTKVGKYTVGLEAVYGEYNCGNKTVGRLKLVVSEGGQGLIVEELKTTKIRDAVIENYVRDLGDSNTFKSLNTNSLMFPNDSGTYPPGVLIYADRIQMNKSFTWYNNWKGLIEVFDTEPKFGVVVLKSPIIPNKLYGIATPSRVWTLLLPGVASKAVYDKGTVGEMKPYLVDIAKSYCTPHLAKELEALGVAA